jgi:hypothetical protein
MMKCSMLALLTLLLLITPVVASAQSYGDGFGIGGVLLPSGAGAILGVTRLGDSLGLEVGLGFNVFDEDDYSSTDIHVSGALKKYWSTDSNFQPFAGGRVSLMSSSYDYGDFGGEGDDTVFGFQGVLGGEYFVTRRVSLEGEVGAGIYFGSFQISTGSRLAAFLYL